jgi:hypothetical protein
MPTLPVCLRAKTVLPHIGKNGAPGRDKSVKPWNREVKIYRLRLTAMAKWNFRWCAFFPVAIEN